MLVVVPAILIVAHETAHALVTVALGGKIEGVVVRGFLAVGVRLRIDGLSAGKVAATLIAGPAAELLVVAAAAAYRPQFSAMWLFLLASQWFMNLIPWPWFPNDGQKLWRLLQHGLVAFGRDS